MITYFHQTQRRTGKYYIVSEGTWITAWEKSLILTGNQIGGLHCWDKLLTSFMFNAINVNIMSRKNWQEESAKYGRHVYVWKHATHCWFLSTCFFGLEVNAMSLFTRHCIGRHILFNPGNGPSQSSYVKCCMSVHKFTRVKHVMIR